jgi:hypothetical protein
MIRRARGRRRLPPRRDARARGLALALWALPVLVIGAIYFSPRHLVSAQTAVTGLLALCVLLLATRRPDRSLLALIILLPFQGLILAKLWDWGIPASVVSHMGAWKETLALAVIVAGVRNYVSSGRSADAIDRIALAFVAMTALYAVLQPDIIPGSPTTSSIRLLGFRETGGFVLVFLGARHANLGPRFAERATRAVFVVGGIVAGIGIYEAIFSSAWNDFIVHTIKYPAYQISVLHSDVVNPQDIRVYGEIGGTRFVRIGSVLLNDLNLAFYLVLPFAVGIEKAVRRKASPVALLTLIAIGAALLLTQTRSGIIAGLIVAFVALLPAAGRPRHWRTQVAIILGGLAVIAIPAAVSTGVVNRFGQVNNKSDQSTAGHEAGFWSGIDTIGANPLGQGLGTAAGVGQRFGVANDKVPENSYLDVGDELGILPMLLFTGLTIVLILRLRRVAGQEVDPLVTAAYAAAAGLAVAAWFLQVWLDFSVAWTLWGTAGAMLGLAPARAPAWTREVEQEQVPHAVAVA